MGATARKCFMQPLVFNVFVVYDEVDKMWVATSDDIPGLVTEAKTFEKLIKRVKQIAPDLLELNDAMPDVPEIPLAFMQSHYTRLPVG